ncbi:MAG TPA: thioredoxin domain-containing protein [Casimicrobiaceae bacterium]|nr:thioredoxin domain-containing protein [Casimicrobiaceae bacterium]
MTNRLAKATSPYLRQHAGNPVDWRPWDDEALALAKRENRPILLSIGYSACHWCHVMAHESFEDPEVAALMNALFVNIKVDREERPDLDQICQTAHALMTRRPGGWPLTVFMTPGGLPFFIGTYFPKESRYGISGFRELLPKVAAAFREHGDEIASQGDALADALASLEAAAQGAVALPAGAPDAALGELERSFDRVHGGFGGAPKFPHAAELEFCLRAAATKRSASTREIVATTLGRMAAGGIADQLGGGFCRYSVDAEWSIPHFEKMLYDNAALLALYADAARALPDAGLGAVARDIVGFLVRELRAVDGAFHSSLDADSEGEEGRFYVFGRDDARAAMSGTEWEAAAPHYGFDGPPNFEDRAWLPRVVVPVADVATRLRTTLPDVQTRIAGARASLFALRSTRVRPARDDKILTAWNALAIGALARASRAQDEPAWADLAIAALDRLVETAWSDGRLLATRLDGDVALNAYLDDYAFLLAALVEVMQARFRAGDLALALAVADALVDRFEDREQGGFWFTSHDHERLFHRTKPAHDNATPSGNGIAAQALIALAHLTADPRYQDVAERTVRAFAPGLAQSPGGQSSLLVALERLLHPPSTLILRGEPALTRAWQRSLERSYRPELMIVDLGDREPPARLAGVSAAAVEGAAAWLCHGFVCRPPVTTLAAIEESLAAA